MNPFFEELRQLRAQQNGDFEVHTERLNAHTRVLQQQEQLIRSLRRVVSKMGKTLQHMAASSADQIATSAALAESFAAYRQRTEKVLDVFQAGAWSTRVVSSAWNSA